MDTRVKKVLIFHTTAGHGHLKAAESIEAKLRQEHPDVVVKTWNALDFFPPLVKKLYVDSYVWMVTSAPFLWGFFYAMSDNKRWYFITAMKRRIFNGWVGGRLAAQIREVSPDVVVSTHFLAPEVCSALKKQGQLRAKTITMVTDFMVHRFWIFANTDQYAVACDETKNNLIKEGIQPERIQVTGVPVGDQFSRRKDSRAMKEKFGLSPDQNTVLFTSGGMGATAIEKLVDHVIKSDDTLQVLVICGNNAKLRIAVDERVSGNPRVKVFDFVDNMDELMDAADIIVGKAGGSTVSEALAKGKPLFILSPVPGQETLNTEVLTKRGAAFEVKDNADLPQMIQSYLKDSNQKNKVQEAVDAMARPEAAHDVVGLIMKP